MITKVKYIICGICVICGLFSCSKMLETESDLVEFEEDHTLNHATDSVYSVMGIINKMQIMKRQCELTADERQMLEDMLNDEFAGDMVKAGVYLLLDRQEEFQQLFETMQEDEKKSLKEFPIWRFVRESEGV